MGKSQGMFIILRPSPYTCAEWEYGGYPYWLQNEENMEVRSRNENYLLAYKYLLAHYLLEYKNIVNILCLLCL